MVWDEPKRDKNRQAPPVGHGLDFADARDRFDWNAAMITPSRPGRHGGARFKAVGTLDGQMVTLIFSLLGTEAVSAISLRTASNRERKVYAAHRQA